MKNKYWVYIFIVLFSMTFCMISCEDFTEEDLSLSQVILLAPSNNSTTGSMVQTFLWQELNGAENYNLQIVSPSYDAIDKLVLDTNINTRLFKYTLFQGSFQWRIKARNFSSEAFSDTFSLEVINTGEIDEVALTSPPDNAASNADVITFRWELHPNANDYNLIVKQNDWDIGTVIFNDTTTYLSKDVNLSEGTYYWGVYGSNDSITSKQVNARKLIIDKTDPELPFNQNPEDTDTIKVSNQQYILTWSRTTNDDVMSDSIYIYEDASQNTLKAKASCSSPQYTFENIDNNTKYYWKLRSFDRAGNASNYTSLLEFFAEYE